MAEEAEEGLDVRYERKVGGSRQRGVFLRGSPLRVLYAGDNQASSTAATTAAQWKVAWELRAAFARAVRARWAASPPAPPDADAPVARPRRVVVLMGAAGLLAEYALLRAWMRSDGAAREELAVAAVDPLLRADLPGPRGEMEAFSKLLHPLAGRLQPADPAVRWLAFHPDVHALLDSPAFAAHRARAPSCAVEVVQICPPYALDGEGAGPADALAGLVVAATQANGLCWMFKAVAAELARRGLPLTERRPLPTPNIDGVGLYAPALLVHRDLTCESRWTGFPEYCAKERLPPQYAAEFSRDVDDALAVAKAAVHAAPPEMNRMSRRLTILNHVAATVLPRYPLIAAVPLIDYAIDLRDLMESLRLDMPMPFASVTLSTMYQSGRIEFS